MGHILVQARNFSKQWNCFVQKVKATAPTYPSISTYRNGPEDYICSNIRINRDGIWYKIPLIKLFDPCAERNSMEGFASEAYKIIYLYRITGSNDMFGHPVEIKDENQSSEEERLTELYCIK